MSQNRLSMSQNHPNAGGSPGRILQDHHTPTAVAKEGHMSRRLRFVLAAFVLTLAIGATACGDVTAPQGACTQGQGSDCPG